MTSTGIGWSLYKATIEFDGEKVTEQQIFAEDTDCAPSGLPVDSEGGVWNTKWDGD